MTETITILEPVIETIQVSDLPGPKGDPGIDAAPGTYTLPLQYNSQAGNLSLVEGTIQDAAFLWDIPLGRWIEKAIPSSPISTFPALDLASAATAGATGEASDAGHQHRVPTAVEVGADPTGTAQGLIDAHNLAGDPHPQYLTPAEGALAYDVLGAASAAQAFAIQRSNQTGTQAQSTIDNLVQDLLSKADLVGGVIPSSQIPAIAISEYLGSVASEVGMLTLTGQVGDWAIRTDQAKVWVITGSDPSLIANWTAISYPASPVTSVNNQTGVITLNASDVQAEPVGAVSSGITSHVAQLDPHPQYLTPAEGDSSYDALGEASSEVAAHVDLADPHPGKYAPTVNPVFTGIEKIAVGGQFQIFNVDIDASNFERGYMRWAGNVLEIGTEKGGTGVKRPARINASDVQIVTPDGGVASFLSPVIAAQAGAIALTINGNGIATFSGNGIVLNDKPLGFNGGFGVAAPDIALRWLLGTYTTAIGVTDSTTNLRDFRCRMLMLPAVAVSQLQPATTSTGVAMVNDALAPVSGDPVVGGGTVTKLVYSDNTTWRVV